MNPLQALFKGGEETLDTLFSTLKSLRMLFMGIELQNAVSGPVRLITDTGAVVAEGFRNGLGPGLLWSFELMSLISVSLAFLNLLPIPVLDGGQIVLFTYELIRNRKLNPKAVYRYQFIGTIIVLLIALAATTGDFIQYNQH
jgi:regulator of sigma E protease